MKYLGFLRIKTSKQVGDIRFYVSKLLEKKALEFASNISSSNSNNNNNNSNISKSDDLSWIIPTPWLEIKNYTMHLAEEPCVSTTTIQEHNHYPLTLASVEKQVFFIYLFIYLFVYFYFLDWFNLSSLMYIIKV